MTLQANVALATFSGMPDGNDDVRELSAALTAEGLGAEVVSWDDPDADWGSYDLVVVRTTWDYTARLDEFLAWADRVPRLLNPPGVLRWNTDKRYLRDLDEAGVPVVPTRWDLDDVPADWPEYVIKPAVSAGSRDTARWRAGEEDKARAHLRSLREAGRTVMIQPYLSAIDTAGETALLFCDREFSHAARKAPILKVGAGLLDAPNGGDITAAEATPEQLAVAERALAAVPGDLLYARVDLVPGPDGAPVVLELELAEPALFLQHAPGSAARYARAIARRVSRPSA
ncbi:RimK family alpha-L-glutamate ligase [Actinomadura sp. 6N118]|uniref:RimK family alpha-L-glutamate ligase n=1 Tax=Actinomadura sp. 6N118 TaxID=3375151 RepID=UPI0037AD3B4F